MFPHWITFSRYSLTIWTRFDWYRQIWSKHSLHISNQKRRQSYLGMNNLSTELSIQYCEFDQTNKVKLHLDIQQSQNMKTYYPNYFPPYIHFIWWRTLGEKGLPTSKPLATSQPSNTIDRIEQSALALTKTSNNDWAKWSSSWLSTVNLPDLSYRINPVYSE